VKGSPRNQATNPGALRGGEVDYQYHGANRLGANSLLSCIYAGMVTGPAIATYRKNLRGARGTCRRPLRQGREARAREVRGHPQDGRRREPVPLHEELAKTMLVDCTIERHNDKLDKVLAKIEEIDERRARSA
jgi:succinate dehydrogenase / fumarate reductase flavoprotein subunit